MYKFLLCWRYLRTRYIALASIISVTLGVATMIVVNSVMAGFRTRCKSRIHGILSDVVFEVHSLDGFHDPEWHMEQIRQVAGEYIEGMTPTVVVPAMLSYEFNGSCDHAARCSLIGIDERTQSQVERLQPLSCSTRRIASSSASSCAKTATTSRPSGGTEPAARANGDAGWHIADGRRQRCRVMQPRSPRCRMARAFARSVAAAARFGRRACNPPTAAAVEPPKQRPPTAATATSADGNARDTPSRPPKSPHGLRQVASECPSDAVATARSRTRTLLESAARRRAAHRHRDWASRLAQLSAVTTMAANGSSWRARRRRADHASHRRHAARRAVMRRFTVVDFYESKMSEYDSNFVFVPIETLQQYRGMFDPADRASATPPAIQIKLQARTPTARRCATSCGPRFRREIYSISTWRDKQGPLLAAVQMETAILNVLLFMIIAVAGFGILAIFFMIVVEKTRDIGILKSLGASRRGILGIFLGYGLSLGIVGSGAGMVIGLLFVAYINEIADVLGMITGHEVFDPVDLLLPADSDDRRAAHRGLDRGRRDGDRRAGQRSAGPPRARLHPVEALRYE